MENQDSWSHQSEMAGHKHNASIDSQIYYVIVHTRYKPGRQTKKQLK